MAIAEGVFKGGWVQVHIYAPTYALPHSCTGYGYCLPGRRLLDQLNDVFPGTISEANDFLPIQEGEIRALRGQSETANLSALTRPISSLLESLRRASLEELTVSLGMAGIPTYPSHIWK